MTPPDSRPAPRPCRVDGSPGWFLPGALPSGAEARLVVIDPAGRSVLVERRRVVLVAAG